VSSPRWPGRARQRAEEELEFVDFGFGVTSDRSGRDLDEQAPLVLAPVSAAASHARPTISAMTGLSSTARRSSRSVRPASSPPWWPLAEAEVEAGGSGAGADPRRDVAELHYRAHR
jgi:hypothetical protein